MTSDLDGTDFTGTVTIYITLDGGTQTIGSVGAGICQAEGRGLYTYRPTAAETDGASVMCTFVGTNAVTATVIYDTLTSAQSSTLSQATSTTSKTVSDLITAALRRINVIAGNDPVESDLAADAFERLNSMIESWSLEDLLVPYTLRTTWTLTSTKGTLTNPYTVGTGGDINIPRPPMPNGLLVRFQDTNASPTLEYRMTMLTDDAWNLIPQKNLTGPLPTSWYYQPTYTGQLGALYLWFVPTQSGLQGVMYSPATIPTFGAITDTIVLPPGYYRALRDNLAVELFVETDYQAQVDPVLMQTAMEAKAAIKRANYRPKDMSVDPALTVRHGFRYNINSDGPS